MSSIPSRCNDLLAQWLSRAGAVKWGVCRAEPVESGVMAAYRAWIERGDHGAMGYLERYDDVRSNPALLLDGAKSIVSCAFPYPAPEPGDRDRQLRIASYALGDDYHSVVRERLTQVADEMHRAWGCDSRVCVDTAPLLERWHAVKAGVGFVGRNRMLIVPGVGSYVFLGEIITTAALPPGEPCTLGCDGCNRCLKACPGGALSRRGLDARRCISYLTIEHRGERFPTGYRPGNRIYGCDRCQEVCPHNLQTSHAAPLPEFARRPLADSLDRETIMAIGSNRWKRLSAGSAMSRITAAMLRRNLAATENQNETSSSIE